MALAASDLRFTRILCGRCDVAVDGRRDETSPHAAVLDARLRHGLLGRGARHCLHESIVVDRRVLGEGRSFGAIRDSVVHLTRRHDDRVVHVLELRARVVRGVPLRGGGELRHGEVVAPARRHLVGLRAADGGLSGVGGGHRGVASHGSLDEATCRASERVARLLLGLGRRALHLADEAVLIHLLIDRTIFAVLGLGVLVREGRRHRHLVVRVLEHGLRAPTRIGYRTRGDGNGR